jgi:hypothetical protein
VTTNGECSDLAADRTPRGDVNARESRSHRRRLTVTVGTVSILVLISALMFPRIFHDSGETRRGIRPVAAGSVQQDTSIAPSCPSQWLGHGPAGRPAGRPAVPSSSGVAPSDRLVPAQPTPAAVRLCAYQHTDDGALSGSKAMTAGLANMMLELSVQPPITDVACSSDLRATDADNFLIAITYERGKWMWVSVPGDHCSGAGNGTFSTSVNLRLRATQWYAAGGWVR